MNLKDLVLISFASRAAPARGVRSDAPLGSGQRDRAGSSFDTIVRARSARRSQFYRAWEAAPHQPTPGGVRRCCRDSRALSEDQYRL